MATAILNSDICIECGNPSAKSYLLRNCSTCKKLLHRRCAKKIAGQMIHCNNCVLLKEKASRLSGNGNTGTPPSNVRTDSTSLQGCNQHIRKRRLQPIEYLLH